MIDVILLVVIAVVTWCVASDGPGGAAITFVSVLLAGLFAMNFFEPLATFLQTNVLGSYTWSNRWDMLALVGLFALGVFGLRTLGEQLMPTYAEVDPLTYDVARWLLGLATGYLTMAILLTALHTAPLPREFLGFRPERQNLFEAAAPDRQWLAFTQYVSEKPLTTGAAGHIFDGARFPRIPGQPETMQVWSSFPIRYAMRREEYASGAGGGSTMASPPGSIAPAAPAAPRAPAPGGGGGTSGF